jgi:3-dehydroquinate synthase
MKLYTHKNINQLQKYIPKECNVFAIIDNKVKDYFKAFKNWNFIGIDALENAKTLEKAGEICSRLMEMKAGRDCFIIGAGGGVTTDLAGFVASIYKRGVRFGLVPTTLLAAADAAIGGKNGVNHLGIKNMMGTITQPEWTFQSTEFFRTLDERVFKEGIAEILKTFLLMDEEGFYESADFFRNSNHWSPSQRQEQNLRSLVRRCALRKMQIVEKDAFDHQARRFLNLGHTFGHALESYYGGEILHGEAVAAGTLAAARLSVKLSLMKERTFDLISDCYSACGISFRFGVKAADLLKYIVNDTKISGGEIVFILPVETGTKTEAWSFPLPEFKKLCKGVVL